MLIQRSETPSGSGGMPGDLLRQLQNIVQRILIAGDDEEARNKVLASIGMPDASIYPSNQEQQLHQWDHNNILTWREMERSLKRQYFQFVRDHSISDSEAAGKLGLAPPNFHRMCKEVGLK